MIRKMIATLACTTLFAALPACTHNDAAGDTKTSDGMAPAGNGMMNGMSKSDMMAKANKMMTDGQAMLAKGTADNNADEKTQGQKMMDDAQKCMADCKSMPDAPSTMPAMNMPDHHM